MALDPEHRRAFLACEADELMTAFDFDKHRPIAFLPLTKEPNVVKYDPGLKRVYVACYSGAISAFQEDDAHHFHSRDEPKNGPRTVQVVGLAVSQRIQYGALIQGANTFSGKAKTCIRKSRHRKQRGLLQASD